MLSQPEFWVAVAFVVLMIVFIYVGVPGVVTKALDHRADRIKAELDDARRLKDEAAALVADYKARYASAEREAQDIVTNAKAEAARLAVRVLGAGAQKQCQRQHGDEARGARKSNGFEHDR